MISQSQARSLAEQHSRAALGEFAYITSPRVLRDDYLEAEHCWMYFMNDSYLLPVDLAPDTKWAHVVSKAGQYAMVQDFSGDADRLQAYLQSMSDYFRERGE
jgi:hypothetical protein